MKTALFTLAALCLLQFTALAWVTWQAVESKCQVESLDSQCRELLLSRISLRNEISGYLSRIQYLETLNATASK